MRLKADRRTGQRCHGARVFTRDQEPPRSLLSCTTGGNLDEKYCVLAATLSSRETSFSIFAVPVLDPSPSNQQRPPQDQPPQPSARQLPDQSGSSWASGPQSLTSAQPPYKVLVGCRPHLSAPAVSFFDFVVFFGIHPSSTLYYSTTPTRHDTNNHRQDNLVTKHPDTDRRRRPNTDRKEWIRATRWMAIEGARPTR